jgi:antitoxin CptB
MSPPEATFGRLPPGGGASGPAEPVPPRLLEPSALLDERSLSRLRWSCRRGLLENDLFIERFFKQHESTLTVRQAGAMSALMDLTDNDLLDLFLRRAEPAGETDTAAIHELLAQIRRPSFQAAMANASI